MLLEGTHAGVAPTGVVLPLVSSWGAGSSQGGE